MIDSLSVFFPSFNEEKNIAVTVEKAKKVLENLKIKKWEILIIDDGSKDKTGEIADQLAKKDKQSLKFSPGSNYKNIRVIHKTNGGYGTALRAGFSNAKYDWIVYTDADGQFDFSEVTKFLAKTDEADVIYAYKNKRSDHFIRTLTAKGWAFSLFLFFGLNIKDVDTGFKMVNRKVLEKIPALESSRGGMINAELVIKAKKYGFRITQVEINHYPRLFGNPTGVKLNVILQSYLDLLNLWWKLK
ncbi:MAG: glycosyltransferase family 2 protein [Candidatus Staskawiczbacteria bacterium]|nr:glycosyltransferase family 2 protein [Candidatus Staskawiczbacteria bacterium]